MTRWRPLALARQSLSARNGRLAATDYFECVIYYLDATTPRDVIVSSSYFAAMQVSN